jgi:hypothetical protein
MKALIYCPIAASVPPDFLLVLADALSRFPFFHEAE